MQILGSEKKLRMECRRDDFVVGSENVSFTPPSPSSDMETFEVHVSCIYLRIVLSISKFNEAIHMYCVNLSGFFPRMKLRDTSRLGCRTSL